jgi:uncharacterized NAD(P)/FAD-binding protein YdhS
VSERFDVAVIGAGASGVLLAAHMAHIGPELRVALLDAGARAARGLAYGTPYGAHLLNVPAAKMSAFEDNPDHFVEWLQTRTPGASGRTYAARSLYGNYLSDVLATITAHSDRITRVAGTAIGLIREGTDWIVHLHDGRTVAATSVVLALGNLPPADPIAAVEAASANYLRDPWAPGAAQGLAPEAPVLIIGTGLTMVDLVLALRTEGHRGPIHAISRRGLLPRAHATYLARPLTMTVDGSGGTPAVGLPGSPRRVMRALRMELAAASAEGHDWRSVIDALRPLTQSIWRSWTPRQRASFLRHARPWWEIHRHRLAPEVADEIDALLRAGTLVVHQGRVVSMHDIGSGVRVQWRDASGAHSDLDVARVINCTGPQGNYSAIDLPLVVQMRRAGWLVPDDLGLGVETNPDGRLVSADRSTVPGLFTIGPLRRPALWESTAIPEIRGQAAALARLLAAEASDATTGDGVMSRLR